MPPLRLTKRSVAYLDAIGLPLWQEGDPMPVLADGVYLGLPEELYFGQDALGSTDLADLWLYREGWWWKSRNNPWRPADMSSKAKLFGSACHTLLLEGQAAFDARYAVEPDPRHFPNLLVSKEDIASALVAISAPGASVRLKKEELVGLAKVYLPDRHVWDAIKERHERASRDKESITAQDRWELGVMLDAAMADPDAAVVVTAAGGVHLSEVSVFYTLVDGVRLRFRFDSLLPSINADLKTLDNYGGRTLADAVGKRIGDSALDVQAAVSFEARRALYDYVVAGQVFGGTEEQRAWLARFPAEAPLDLGDRPGWSWLWMFYQKADMDGRAPVIFMLPMEFGSPEHLDGWRKCLHALAFYREKVATVGLATPWTKVETGHRMDERAPKRVTIPHWIERPMRVAGEEEGVTWRA